MDASPYFKVVGDHAVLRPSGQISLKKAAAMVTSAIVLARGKGIGKLLVVASDLTGLPSPTVSERYSFAKEWAEAAEGAIRVAMVLNPELIDPEKFGVTVARNRGLIADVFTSEEAAFSWLQGQEDQRRPIIGSVNPHPPSHSPGEIG